MFTYTILNKIFRFLDNKKIGMRPDNLKSLLELNYSTQKLPEYNWNILLSTTNNINIYYN